MGLLPILLTRNAREPSASDLLVLHDLVGTAELSLHFPADHASYTNFAATVSSTAIPEIEWDLAQKGTGGQQKVAAPSWQPHRCAPSRCHHSLLTILREADVSVNTTGGAPDPCSCSTPHTAAHQHCCPSHRLQMLCALPPRAVSPELRQHHTAAAASTCSALTLDDVETGSLLFPLCFAFLSPFITQP